MNKKATSFMFLILLGTIVLLSANHLYADEEAYQDVPEIYIVKKGDTLWDISENFLKDPFQWPEVWKNNDYVINPDLIYPGNKLMLRKLFKEVFPPKVKKVKIKTTKPVVAKPVLPGKVPVTNLSVFRTAGFIVRNISSVGTIIDSPLDRFTLSEGDTVYTDVGSGGNTSLGKKYLIYRMIRNIEHPITHKDMGYLVKIVGALKIKKFMNNNSSSAVITDSYEEIARDDLLYDYADLKVPMIDTSLQPQEKNIPGYIIATKDGKTEIGLRDIAYLDAGKNQGVAPGDMFIAYRKKGGKPGDSAENTTFKYPKIIIGELKIIYVKDETSTVLITKSPQELTIGDKVEYKLPVKKD